MEAKSAHSRENFAKEIKKTPKEERKEILEKVKETGEYWQARTEKIAERQDEEKIDDGLGVLIKKKTIYHGSGTDGIKIFNVAEEDTVGSGVYFTSEAKDAIGYARRRSKRKEGNSPVIYESSIENMKLLDLRNSDNVKQFLSNFKDKLAEKLKDPEIQWYYRAVLERTIESIDAGKIGPGNLREISFSIGKEFSDHVKSLGYEGLITFEGGEGEEVGNHDTYLIFDPEKIKINREHKII